MYMSRKMESDRSLHEDFMYKLSIGKHFTKILCTSYQYELVRKGQHLVSKNIWIKSYYHVSAVNAKIYLLWNNFPV